MIDLDDIDPAIESRLRSSLLARADLASGVTGPDPALFRTSAPRRVRRRNALLVAAAIALAVAGIAALLRAPDDRRIDVVPATTVPVETRFPDTGFVPDLDPGGLSTPTSFGYHSSSSTADSALMSLTFARNDRPLVFAEIVNRGAVLDDGPGLGSALLTVHGWPARAWTDHGREGLMVASRTGRSVVLSGRVERSELAALVPAIDVATLSVNGAALPARWALFEDPQQIAAIGTGDEARHAVVGFIGSSRISEDGPVSWWLAWCRSSDPAAAMDLLSSVWGGESSELADGRQALRIDVSVPDPPGLWAAQGSGSYIVWAVDRDHLAWLYLEGIEEDATDIAVSVRATTVAEWDELGAGSLSDARPGREELDADGFRVDTSDGGPVEAGSLVGALGDGAAPAALRWKVVPTTNVPNIALGGVGFRLLLMDSHGRMHSSSSIYRTVGAELEPALWRDDEVAGVAVLVPTSIEEPGLSFGGAALETVVVQVGGNTQLVFGVGASIDMPSDPAEYLLTSGGVALDR